MPHTDKAEKVPCGARSYNKMGGGVDANGKAKATVNACQEHVLKSCISIKVTMHMQYVASTILILLWLTTANIYSI